MSTARLRRSLPCRIVTWFLWDRELFYFAQRKRPLRSRDGGLVRRPIVGPATQNDSLSHKNDNAERRFHGVRMVCVTCLMAGMALAQAPVTLTVDVQAPGAAIPADFLGLSFEASNLLPEKNGEYLFGPENKPLIALFRVLGIGSLRIGGSTADIPGYPVPGEKDIDRLFAFATASGVKVLYTLRLPRANVENDAAIAKYIEQRYSSQVVCFEIGNEPDFYRRVYKEIPDYPTYRDDWQKIAGAVTRVAPGAKFCGPAAGGTTAWSRSMAEDFAKSGLLAAVVQHEYPGGDGGLISGAPARDAMLSRGWIELYDRLYNSFAVTARSNGLPYRLEETNNFTGGAKDATDTFTAALWALDYLHWWAAHGASGLNFHNRRWILNTTIYPVTSQDDGLKSGYRLHPIAYGIKAFDLAGHGTVVPVTIANPAAVNLTAYAVRDGSNLLLTVINKKDPGASPQDAGVRIVMQQGAPMSAEAVFLAAPNQDVAAKEGITLGGSSIVDGSWDGKWTAIAMGKGGEVTVKVPGVSAAIMKLSFERKTQ